tara:strand:- start:11529 stop:12812 length:1284 start_codon:yes stop_codon:yes gene_type:complete
LQDQVLKKGEVLILVFGVNHKSAIIETREQAHFSPEEIIEALHLALRETGLKEAAILSTCNRTELYGVGNVSDYDVLRWLSRNRNLQFDKLRDAFYCYRDLQALRHLILVSSGLDSMVLGEPQIFGQIKSAYSVGREAGTVSSSLNQAFQHVFSTVKRIRTETAIGQSPVSVAYASVRLARQIFSDFESKTTLLIGAGETIELVARHLGDQGMGEIIVANRTLSRARDVVKNFASKIILLSDIPQYLHKADILISSTASQLPILGKGAVEDAIKKRRKKPMLLIDLAVPRDIEPQVNQMSDVYLYNVDDLTNVVQDGLSSRRSAADAADVIIEQEIKNWARHQRALNAVDTIRAFRKSIEILRDMEVEKALSSLRRGQDSEEVINTLARNLTNKLMHKPTTRLKLASEEGRDDTIHATKDLFGLTAE